VTSQRGPYYLLRRILVRNGTSTWVCRLGHLGQQFDIGCSHVFPPKVQNPTLKKTFSQGFSHSFSQGYFPLKPPLKPSDVPICSRISQVFPWVFPWFSHFPMGFPMVFPIQTTSFGISDLLGPGIRAMSSRSCVACGRFAVRQQASIKVFSTTTPTCTPSTCATWNHGGTTRNGTISEAPFTTK